MNECGQSGPSLFGIVQPRPISEWTTTRYSAESCLLPSERKRRSTRRLDRRDSHMRVEEWSRSCLRSGQPGVSVQYRVDCAESRVHSAIVNAELRFGHAANPGTCYEPRTTS